MKKRFPSYFENFSLPECAVEQEIEVYRACPTRKIEKASFLNSFEEQGFMISAGRAADDPQEYCLSTCWNLRDIRRFVAIDSRFSPPFLLAKGITHPSCGVSCFSKEWKPKYKGSHVDWWLYKDAEPWLHFAEVNYEKEYAAFPERR